MVQPERVLAIDPGNELSGWSLLRLRDRRPLAQGKTANAELIGQLVSLASPVPTLVVLEQVKSYGMAPSDPVLDTVLWSGRFIERLSWSGIAVFRVPRAAVRIYHCRSVKAKDGNVTAALVERFAAGQPNRGKGVKADPGWFYGFSADMWQAYALGVYAADLCDPCGAVPPVVHV